MNSVKQNLLTAADFLEERGLAKYRRVGDEGRLCAVAALTLAAVGDPFALEDCVEKEIALIIKVGNIPPTKHGSGSPGWAVADWSNQQTDAAPVVALFRKAAEVA